MARIESKVYELRGEDGLPVRYAARIHVPIKDRLFLGLVREEAHDHSCLNPGKAAAAGVKATGSMIWAEEAGDTLHPLLPEETETLEEWFQTTLMLRLAEAAAE